jgi:hypothetical protein
MFAQKRDSYIYKTANEVARRWVVQRKVSVVMVRIYRPKSRGSSPIKRVIQTSFPQSYHNRCNVLAYPSLTAKTAYAGNQGSGSHPNANIDDA